MTWWGKESPLFGNESKLGGTGTSQYPESPLGAIPNWKENFQYIKDQEVMDPATGLYYRAVDNHYATEVFANDLANGFWVLMIADGGNPTLQEVTNSGNTTTQSIFIDDANSRTVLSPNAIGGLLLPSFVSKWNIENSTGNATFAGSLENKNGVVKPYQEYVVFIAGSGENDPEVSDETEGIIDPRFSGIVWTRNSDGDITGTKNNAFIGGKTFIFWSMPNQLVGFEEKVSFYRVNDDTISGFITDSAGIGVDTYNVNLRIIVRE